MGKNTGTSHEFIKLHREFHIPNEIHLKLYKEEDTFLCRKQDHIANPADSHYPHSIKKLKVLCNHLLHLKFASISSQCHSSCVGK